MRESLPAVTLNPGQGTSGQIAFQIPSTQTISKLEYNNPFTNLDEIMTNLPQVTSWVSEPSFFGTITSTGINSSQLSATYTFDNKTNWYYSGDVIALKVSLNDFYFSGNITLNTLSLTTSDTGFTISSIDPPLPVMVRAGGGEVDVYVYIIDPASSFTGSIDFNGTTS